MDMVRAVRVEPPESHADRAVLNEVPVVMPAGLRFVIAVLVFAVLPGLHTASAFPVVGTGDIHFALDQASFRSGAGTTESEFYLEVYNDELAFKPDDGRLQAEIEFHLEFYADDDRIERKSYPLKFSEGGLGQVKTQTQVLQLRVAPPAESDSVHARVEDKNARKRGLFHLFTSSPKSGEARASLGLREFPDGQLSLSDLQFARTIGLVTADAAFVKSGMDVEPNPGRVYGAPDRRIYTYLEVYDLAPRTGDPRRRYEIDYRLRDQDGNEVKTWQRALASRNPTWADTLSFDSAGLAAGTYFLGAVVRDLTGGGRAAVESHFEVVWASDNWMRWMAWTDGVASFLFPSEELDYYLTLGPGAKERYIEEFWARNDPTPGPANATREEFERRIAYANDHYSSTIEEGMRTDRGRVYIRYGEPDELRREVVPVQGNDINAALREIERGTGGELQGHRDIDPEDSRAFEVWVYDYRGYELFPAQNPSRSLGLQFVFVDDLGVGDFQLIRSSERDEF